MKPKITAGEFEALVRGAVKSLPREFKRRLENINVVILAEPPARQKKEAGEELLGLYEGVPLGERTHRDGCVLPDKITVFRGPILRACRSRRSCLHRKNSKVGRAGPDNRKSSHRDQALAIRKAVRDTVLHEFAHYFGISDEHMVQDGTY